MISTPYITTSAKLSALLISFVFIACNTTKSDQKSTDVSEKQTVTTADTEDNLSTFLTDKQVQTAGLMTSKLVKRTLNGTLKANGRLIVPHHAKATATSLFGGVIQELKIKVGDYVRKGQLIASISNPEFVQLQEDYLTVNNQITLAEQELTRQRALNDGQAGAIKNLEQAVSTLKAQKIRAASIGRQLEMMGIDPQKINERNLRTSLQVLSPISGTVSQIFTNLGSYVDVSAPLMEIINNQGIQLDLQVYEKDLSQIAVGQQINFVVTNNPDKHYQAIVYNIGSSFTGDSKTIAVHCTVLGNTNALIEGMNTTATIKLAEQSHLAVPNEALVSEADTHFIYVVSDKSEKETALESSTHHYFRAVKVNIGTSAEGYTAIMPEEMLSEETEIVSKGSFFVHARRQGIPEEH